MRCGEWAFAPRCWCRSVSLGGMDTEQPSHTSKDEPADPVPASVPVGSELECAATVLGR
jgi:hypothetical protein